MMTLTLIDGNLAVQPVLVESTGVTFHVTTRGKVSVLIGNSNNRNEMFFIGAQHDGGEIEINGLSVGSYVGLVSSKEITTATLRWRGEGALFITAQEVSMLSRPCYTDATKMLRYIYEAEQNNIKPALGDEVFVKAKTTQRYPLLLEGGTYDKDGKTYTLAGLKRALAYYVYSRLVESSSVELTRQGVVNRNGEYSDEASRQDRIDVSRETYAIADRYMEECIRYIRSIDGESCDDNNNVNSNRTKIKIIGV